MTTANESFARPMRVLSILCLLILSPLLSGCELAIGAGAAVGVTAMEERGIETAAHDTKIHAQIIDKWFSKDSGYIVKAGIEVYEGRVLLTGAVDNAAVRADLVQMAWSVPGVTDVINEIQETSGDVSVARDTWITTQIKTKITFDKNVLAINYKVETVGGAVYLIGVAQNQAELDRVIAHARAVSYVRNVVSHVRVKGTA